MLSPVCSHIFHEGNFKYACHFLPRWISLFNVHCAYIRMPPSKNWIISEFDMIYASSYKLECIEQRLVNVGPTQGRVGYGSIYTSVGPRTKILLFCFSLHGTVPWHVRGKMISRSFLFCLFRNSNQGKFEITTSGNIFLKLLQSWLQHK